MTLLLIYLFIALTVSFLCSIMEAVLLSSPLSYLKVKEEAGKRGAIIMIKLKQNIDRPLSAILSLNTVAHTVGAAGVGAQATIVFGEEYFGLVSAILTILILVLTEIFPKTIGARYWRELAGVSAIIIRAMIFITYPLVIASSFITKIFSSKSVEQTTSREEISVLANIGAEEGVFGEKENKIIQNLIRLKSIKTYEVMTPRVVVSVADENMELDDFLKNKEYLRFSRIPVYSENDEHITGYVFRQTVFEKLAEDKVGLKLKDLKREIVFIPNSKPLLGVWELLLEKKEHIAVVVDEYGGMDGIVTMEDIIETLLGFEIVDEKDTIADMQQFARERWKMRQEKYRFIDKIEKDK
ncbi:MAG TPA: hemolysin family protein [Tenuifilaceae bacterium]|nr:hemolysin family protein [Tenuifilaceae bacterium]HPI45251.1 hemolysin family protein [Tenuifilaceae bacterium]HPN22951.1 hemolysin family protein [Tenuifilaceae bacterium]